VNTQRNAIVAVSLGMLALSACVTKGTYEKELQARKNAEEQRDQYRAYVTETDDERRRLLAELDRLRMQVTDTSRNAAEASLEKQKYVEKLNELETRLRNLGTNEPAVASGDVSVFQTPEGTVVEIKEGVLFDSGKKEIKAKGKEILDKIAEEIAKTSYNVRIDGHTDADPVKVHAKEFPLGNLQLSAERAVEVAGYLAQKAKPTSIPEGRISVAGYGPNRPRTTGTSADDKRKNRRVDIVILNAPSGTIGTTDFDGHGGDGK
jgi:flagellar motor protein MotB